MYGTYLPTSRSPPPRKESILLPTTCGIWYKLVESIETQQQLLCSDRTLELLIIFATKGDNRDTRTDVNTYSLISDRRGLSTLQNFDLEGSKEIISMNSSGSTPASRRLHSRVAFVPNTGDLYGAINCADGGTSNFNNDPVASNNSKDVSKISNRLKPGPPLLEIRKINYSTFDEQEESQPQSSWSPFQHETILVSRGIPGSVSSTCLDFAKSSSQTIRCATGLTSGALAVHSISNILAYSLNSNIGDESNLDLPTSTVTHYAPRQQRPSSCVAWHPAALGANSKNGLVAIGLVGSAPPPGNTNSISKAATARGLPVGSASSLTSGSSISTTGIGGSTTMGGSTDRDFGCLVWDIEAQSSSVSGAGTVRGKSAAVGGRGSPPPAKGKGSVPIKSPLYRFFVLAHGWATPCCRLSETSPTAVRLENEWHQRSSHFSLCSH